MHGLKIYKNIWDLNQKDKQHNKNIDTNIKQCKT